MADDTRASFSDKSKDRHPAAGEASSPSYLDEALNLVMRRDANSPSVTASGPTLEGYAKQFVKAVPLFLAGRTGIVGSALLYAADQMHSGASLSDNAMGGALGLAQGATLKWSFDKIGGTEWNPVAKGALMGLSGRTVGTFFDSANWKTADGTPSFGHALSTTWNAGSDVKSLAADGLIFAGSYGLVRKLGAAGYGSVVESRLMGNALSGTVYGASSGAFNEVQRQQSAGQGFDLAAVAKESLISGAITGAAAIPGGMQASIKFHQSDFGPYTPAESKANAAQLSAPKDSVAAIETVTGNEKTTDWKTYQAKNISRLPQDVHVYNVAGSQTELVVPRSFDTALTQFRDVRDVASQSLTETFVSDPLQAARIAIARIKLDMHPLRGTYLPEDLVPGIQQMPNNQFVPRVFTLNEAAPYDAFCAQAKQSTSPVLAQQQDNGDVVFFKRSNNIPRDLNEQVLHEWSHAQHREQPVALTAFGNAVALEHSYNRSDYAKSSIKENWAEHSQSLLGQEKQAFADFVRGAPIRAAVLGRALSETLANTPQSARSADHDLYQQRADWIAQTVEPRARQELQRLSGNSPAFAENARVVLDYLSGNTGDFRETGEK